MTDLPDSNRATTPGRAEAQEGRLSPLSDRKLGELARLARTATPGPWVVSHDPDGIYTREPGALLIAEAQTLVDEVFIAAADPTTLLALVAEIRRRRAEQTRWRAALEWYASKRNPDHCADIAWKAEQALGGP
jgi:hypothetical protein